MQDLSEEAQNFYLASKDSFNKLKLLLKLFLENYSKKSIEFLGMQGADFPVLSGLFFRRFNIDFPKQDKYGRVKISILLTEAYALRSLLKLIIDKMPQENENKKTFRQIHQDIDGMIGAFQAKFYRKNDKHEEEFFKSVLERVFS